MGFQERDYYRDDRLAGRGGDFMKTMVAKLIVVNAVVYLADIMMGTGKLMDMLAVPNDVLRHPLEWWKLLTAAFAHAPLNAERGLWHIAGNMFMLFMFGREMEMRYGSREFLRIYLLFAVGASLIWVAAHQLFTPNETSYMLGASGAVVGVVILFTCNFPRRMLAFPPVPMWVAGVFYVALDAWGATQEAVGVVADEDRTAFMAHLGGALLGFLYFKSGIRLDRWSLPVGRWKPSLKRAPKLKVHDPEQHYAELDRRADAILEKVNRYGVDSISAEERRILDDYSRRMRQKHR